VAIEAFDFTTDTLNFSEAITPTNWQSATVSGGQWSYDLPAGTEGFYDVYLRSRDNFGNMEDERVVWRGLIDTIDPVIAASGQHIAGGTAAQTEYTFTFTDFILDESSYEQPCGTGALMSLTYAGAELPHDGLPYEVTATCRVTGHETNRAFTVCDSVGHCVSETIVPDPTMNEANILILTPLSGANLTATIPISITGGAYDLDEIATIAVAVDGAVIDTIVPGAGVTDTPWSATWSPPVSGAYTITAMMTDTLGNSVMDTVMVTAFGNLPTAVADTYTTTENTPLHIAAPGVLDNDSDPNGDPLTAVLQSGTTNGALTLLSDGAFIYTPTTNFNGADSFVYSAHNGILGDTAVVTVIVNGVNDAPTAVDDAYTVDENSSDNLFDVLVNDSDSDGDALTIVAVSAAGNGTAVISGTAVLYTPDPDFVGTDTFTYTITDGFATSTATVNVTVEGVAETGFTIYLPFLSKP
jgi:hypothetical protein